MKAVRGHVLSLFICCLFFFTAGPFVSFAQTVTDTATPTPSFTPVPTPAPTQAPGNTATPTPTCTMAGVPAGLSAASSGPTQITLTWTAPSGSVDHYILSYGTASGNYTYGNPSIPGTATSYVVSSLSKGTKYYFAMKAQAGCSSVPSAYSSEVSATAGETPSGTPSPSPQLSQVPEEQAQPQMYQAANEQAVPQQAVRGAQAQQGGFVTIPTFTPTPTPSPIGSTVNIVSLIGAAIVFLIVGLAVFYYSNGRQGVPSNEKVEF